MEKELSLIEPTVDQEKIHQINRGLSFSIVTASVLVAVKLATGILTHSMAILASALDSLMDVATSIVNLIAAREASRPPDEEHAYGHEKVESLAALFQCVFIALTGFYVLFEVFKRFKTGTELRAIPVGMAVMIFSIVLTALLVWRLDQLTKTYHSLILRGEKLHYWTDILTNGGVIFALIIVQVTKGVYWDLIISVIITVYIFKETYEVFRSAINELLDRSLSPHLKREVESIVLDFHPSIVGIHRLRSRQVGEKSFLDFHIEIRGEGNFNDAHQMTEGLIARIQESLPQADVTVHFDPEGAK